MIIKQFVAGFLENNMYLVLDETSKKGVLIDATDMLPEIKDATKDYDIEYILITHGHFDHILGMEKLKEELNAKTVINKEDLVVSDNINEYTELFNLPKANIPSFDIYIKDGDEINVGNLKFKVISTPGHTAGGVCYLVDDKLFSGDTLFRGSVGRTDLFGGNFEKLEDSIKNKLFKLDENIEVYSGHGPKTTIGYEKKYNEIINY